ncbi:hypothetical protein E3N88_38716 [Mikania micrantha]|uniref:Chromo domain-containing protein n=1 Tax=Mikania micrantha TaxID=192012 RepID=A0A5N6LUU0_9ASTR|nr:hypothetical protein E3N88_38716 [Mikania micrantha]
MEFIIFPRYLGEQVNVSGLNSPLKSSSSTFSNSKADSAIQGNVESILPKELEVGEEDLVLRSKILAVRKLNRGSASGEEWLIQWQGQKAEEATWENAQEIKTRFPHTSLEVKTLKEDGGIDRNEAQAQVNSKPPILHVYSRKGKRGI